MLWPGLKDSAFPPQVSEKRSGPWPWALSPMTCVADAHLGLPVLTADGVGPHHFLTITP